LASIFARLLPFRAIRYNQDNPDVDLGMLVAPPGEGTASDKRALPANQPFHALHLFPPGGGKANPARLEEAEQLRLHQTFQHWWQAEVLLKDPSPSVYLHRLTFEAEDGSRLTRRGFFAVLGLSPSGTLRVLPHENTLPGRLTRQIQILEAVGAQVLPIFLIYSDPTDSVLHQLESCAVESDVLASFTDGLGQEHRLQRVGDAELTRWLETQFHDKEVVIADGHHRFDSLRELWRSHGVQEADALGLPVVPDAEAYIAVYLTSADAPGFRVGAIHRVLRSLPRDYESHLRSLEPLYHRIRLPLEEHRAHGILAKLATAGAAAFGLYATGEDGWDLLYPRADVPHPALEEVAPPLRELDVTRLHQEILPLLTDGQKPALEFEKDAGKALAEVESGRSALACFLNPIRPEQIWDVAREGLTMPPKATYFYPKIPAGLVAIPLADER
jgi:uncharacterized protein (DUF1015 family)